MSDREPNTIKQLRDALLEARGRRDREERFSEPWHAADAEMHAIERAIFRLPPGGDTERRGDEDQSWERAG
jgi:hypothetical protein